MNLVTITIHGETTTYDLATTEGYNLFHADLDDGYRSKDRMVIKRVGVARG
jgi:hypothetical protein